LSAWLRVVARASNAGRLELELLEDDTFVASHDHRRVKREWRGKLSSGTFAKARDALAHAGFPNVPPLGELVPGEGISVIRWLSCGEWTRALVKDDWTLFSDFIKVTSTILTVLDSNLARMPPGETTPVIEQHLVETCG
jgi:hypothetical protein